MVKAIRKPKKPKIHQRRTPQRAGSEATVEAIFGAAARILKTVGRAGFNTNRVAEIAGISIGTLYGYFPNKQAILLAMARRELQSTRDRVAAAIVDATSTQHPARRAIRALIDVYRDGGPVRQILMETLYFDGGADELTRPVAEIADLIVSHSGNVVPSGPERLSPIGLYVLTHAVDNVVRMASYQRKDFAQSREFEDELMRLVFGFVGWPLADGDAGADHTKRSDARG